MIKHNIQEERIMVCVNYGYNGHHLINRGSYLSKQLNAPLYMLIFDSLSDIEFQYEKKVDMTIFENMADEFNAELLIVKSHKFDITDVISDYAKKFNITQIIIGQHTESAWSNILGGSIINEILKKAPSIDLHVIPKQQVFEEELWDYDRGVEAFLIKDDKNNSYRLSLDPRSD